MAIEIETLLANVVGKTVVRWQICEMALLERGENGMPLFQHKKLPFRQAIEVSLSFSDGSCLRFLPIYDDLLEGTTQVEMRDEEVDLSVEWSVQSIFRVVDIKNAPLGRLMRVETSNNSSGGVSKIEFTLENRWVAFKVAEVHETGRNVVRIVEGDQAILLFFSRSDYKSIRFGSQIELDP